MSIQDKISLSSLSRKRKLYDNNITNTGYERLAIRLTTETDWYGDETLTLETHEKIICVIDWPGGIPLFTERDETGETNRVGSFVYDMLPIEGRFRFQDNVQSGDIILMKVYEDVDEHWVEGLRITEIVGNVRSTVVSKVYTLAPYKFAVTSYPAIQQLINDYDAGVI